MSFENIQSSVKRGNMANPHFKYLSRHLSELRKQEYLLDAELFTMQNQVHLHKVMLAVYSSHIRDSNSNIAGKWEILANCYSANDVENLVDFLYDGEAKIGDRVMELVKSLHLDLSVDQKIRKKKISKGESVQNMVNLELKYLRDLVFEMEIPKLLGHTKACMDVTIRVGGKTFNCHKVILAAMSSYFQVMFTSGMKEEKEKIIVIQGIEPEVFNLVLNYIYTGKNPVRLATAQDLLSAAGYLQIEMLQNLCEEFLCSNLDVNNCVDILNLATTYTCIMLSDKARKFIIENFMYINRLKMIRNLKLSDMQTLLKDDNLNVNDEKEVLQFVLDWVSTNRMTDQLDELLQSVRLCSVDKVFLEDILKNNAIIKNQDSSKKIIQNSLTEQISSNAVFTSNPRKEKTFLVVKQSSMLPGVELACYSLIHKKWYLLEPNTKSAGGTGFSACATENSIFVTGGSANPFSFYMFSLAENKWTQLADMQYGRHSHAIGCVNDAIFVLGGSEVGSDVFTVILSIEKYDLKEMEWKSAGNMEIPTYDSAFASVKTKIYIFGGAIGTIPGVYIKDIQCFDTITQTCTRLYHNLPFTLSLAVACSSNRDIYITCPNGKMIHYNEDSPPTVINETKGSQLMGYATLFHDNSVYIMGGYSMIGETEAVHRFDLQTKRQVKSSQLKLPFKKQTNQYFACSVHVSRKFLKTGYMTVEQSLRLSDSPR